MLTQYKPAKAAGTQYSRKMYRKKNMSVTRSVTLMHTQSKEATFWRRFPVRFKTVPSYNTQTQRVCLLQQGEVFTQTLEHSMFTNLKYTQRILVNI